MLKRSKILCSRPSERAYEMYLARPRNPDHNAVSCAPCCHKCRLAQPATETSGWQLRSIRGLLQTETEWTVEKKNGDLKGTNTAGAGKELHSPLNKVKETSWQFCKSSGTNWKLQGRVMEELGDTFSLGFSLERRVSHTHKHDVKYKWDSYNILACKTHTFPQNSLQGQFYLSLIWKSEMRLLFPLLPPGS